MMETLDELPNRRATDYEIPKKLVYLYLSREFAMLLPSSRQEHRRAFRTKELKLVRSTLSMLYLMVTQTIITLKKQDIVDISAHSLSADDRHYFALSGKRRSR